MPVSVWFSSIARPTPSTVWKTIDTEVQIVAW